MVNSPFFNATFNDDNLLTAVLKDAGLATRLGIITPILTESLSLIRVDILGLKLLTIISSNLVILLILDSDSRY